MEDLRNAGNVTTGDEIDAARAEKMAVLTEAMKANQPDFEDFRGQDGYSDRMIEADKERLAEKMTEIRARDEERPEDELQDEYAKSAEPVLTYILGDVRFLANRGQKTFSFLASEYDDKLNGTDVVLGVEKPDGSEFLGFAVDVATGVDERNIQKKIASSAMERRDGGKWSAFVKYCKWGQWRWKEPEAPHFVLGLSPAGLDVALDKIVVEDGMIKGREADPETDFKLASELKEEIGLQMAELKRWQGNARADERMESLKVIERTVNSKLVRLIGAKGATSREVYEDFMKKYPKMRERFMTGDKAFTRDEVYINIMKEILRRKAGAKAMRSV